LIGIIQEIASKSVRETRHVGRRIITGRVVRALTIDAHGGLEQLSFRDDIAMPELVASNDVRIRVRAAALNHIDLWALRGVPGMTLVPPWILGSDAVGVVDAVGASVTSVRVGDTVMVNPGVSCRECEYCLSGDNPLCLRFGVLGEHRPGTLADFLVVPQENVRVVPATVSPEYAAAFSLAALTAWRMCVTRAKVTAGDDVLIWGIGGGVAQMALAICKMRGARVWVTSGSEAKLARARDLGADELLRHGTGIDIGREVRARTGKRGVTVVVDTVGTETWSQSLGALGRRGRLVTSGGTSGHLVETDVRRLFWNQWTIMGSTMGSDAEYDTVVAEFLAGRLVPQIDSVHSLEHAAGAFARLASGVHFGKVVVRISE
jgi:NADPH:quinone reductase-like Zn-dependent oxidoreductase